ncbi:hypothetical protein FACS189432_02800 [Bacteroidia bacterium]|nr:hypothetical protein FACS189432_02800 [Bacteroidia bacterium]GHV71125.1 hypothetical protein FACS189420_5030 [Bacteroidia bacterium]
MEDFIIFNPDYFLKPDSGRALIMAKHLGRKILISDGFETFIHPIHAIILCFMNGNRGNVSIKKVADYLKISKEFVENFVNKLLYNENFVKIYSKEGISTFPPQTLIYSKCDEIQHEYNPDEFLYHSIDLIFKRHFTPSSITLMVNNRCLTNCFYCYADRRMKMDCKIPFHQIKEIIKEAKKLNVRSFDVIGGEFFLYKHWKELLMELQNNEYLPYLSTKIPITEEDIVFLADLKIKDIQISLDTLINEHLMSILNVKTSYIDEVKNTLYLLNKYNIKVYIHTVLTQKNDTIADMKSIVDFIEQFDNILEWKIDKASMSLYLQEPYSNIKPRENNINEIASFISSISEKVKYSIRSIRPVIKNKIINTQTGKSNFFNRGICSGNYSSFFILPDGKVTLCEELYWMNGFILGDVTEQSLYDIWNSQRAIELYNFNNNQTAFPKDSLCSSCNQFKECREVKQICWKETIKFFGKEKWYYPDVNCPKISTIIK